MDKEMVIGTKLSDLDTGALAHYGVKGMRWGVRNDKDRVSKSSKKEGSVNKNKLKEEKLRVELAKVKAKNDVAVAKINARNEAKIAKVKAKTPEVSKLTNNQLKERNERMNLEKNYKKLVEESRVKTPSEKALDYVKDKAAMAANQAVDRAIREAMNATMDAVVAEAKNRSPKEEKPKAIEPPKNKGKKDKSKGDDKPPAPKPSQNAPKTPQNAPRPAPNVPPKVMRTPVSQLPLQGPPRPNYMRPMHERRAEGPMNPIIDSSANPKLKRKVWKKSVKQHRI